MSVNRNVTVPVGSWPTRTDANDGFVVTLVTNKNSRGAPCVHPIGAGTTGGTRTAATQAQGVTVFHNQQFSDQPLAARPQFGRPQLEHEVGCAERPVVERWIDQPSHPVIDVLRDPSVVAPASGFALGGGRTLLFDEAPQPAVSRIVRRYESWHATARLLNRRGRTVARIDIEIGIGAPGVSIQMRPHTRHPHRWGARRVRRYFALAHDAVDEFERVLRYQHAVPAGNGALTIRSIDPDDIDALRALTDVLDIDLSSQSSAGVSSAGGSSTPKES
jgi:hypothetical protein